MLALTIDVEDWFTVTNYANNIPFSEWKNQEQRLRVGLDFILQELSKRKIHATFFVLGWAAEQDKHLIKDIENEGHEIACHSYAHQLVHNLSPDAFATDLSLSLQILRSEAKQPIVGYRAPSFSLSKRTSWAFSVLKRHGIQFDSSLRINTDPFFVQGVRELPLPVLDIGPQAVPYGGGGYFRAMPYPLTKTLLAQRSQLKILYFHPWEFDSLQPTPRASFSKQWRHRLGLKQNREKFRRLLDEFSFTSLASIVANLRKEEVSCPVDKTYSPLASAFSLA